MVEIDDLFDVGEAASEVDDVVVVCVVFAEGEVVDYELSVACGEGLGRDCVLVFVLFCALEDLGDVGLFHWVLL